MIIEMFVCLLVGIGVGIDAFLKVLPICNQFSGIKEQLISAALGLPVIIVSIMFLIVKIIRKQLHS